MRKGLDGDGNRRAQESRSDTKCEENADAARKQRELQNNSTKN